MITIDPSNRWKVLGQFGQIATYYSKLNEGVYTSGFQVSNTFWEDVSQNDVRMHPELLFQQKRVVHLWASQMSGAFLSGVQIAPKLDDKVVDNMSGTWYAAEVSPLDWDGSGYQRYRVLCYLGT